MYSTLVQNHVGSLGPLNTLIRERKNARILSWAQRNVQIILKWTMRLWRRNATENDDMPSILNEYFSLQIKCHCRCRNMYNIYQYTAENTRTNKDDLKKEDLFVYAINKHSHTVEWMIRTIFLLPLNQTWINYLMYTRRDRYTSTSINNGNSSNNNNAGQLAVISLAGYWND